MTDIEQDKAFAEALGAEIRYWRERRSMSRPELAAKAGTSDTTMGRIERSGPVDVSLTWRICMALDVPLAIVVERATAAMRFPGAPTSDESTVLLNRDAAERGV
jgi:transcriptional regulator with XRE-family HTH domain